MNHQFNAGDRVTDPRHGFATVTFVGTEYVGLRFEDGRRDALFKFSDGALHPGWDESVLVQDSAEESQPPPIWPASTFHAEGDNAEHFMGSHWGPFAESGPEVLLKQLPEILSAATPLGGFGEHYRSPRPEPEAWSRGIHLLWPTRGDGNGLVVTLRFDTDASRVISLYPHVHHGVQTSLRLNRVRVWEGGVEAQIDATWGETEITFFDTAFLLNRGWYEAGMNYDFLLAGIAYSASPATQNRIPHTPHPDQIAWQRLLAAERNEPPPEVTTYIDFSGAAILLPIAGWDDDEYSFRGTLKAVEAFGDFLGQEGWKVRVTVMRFGDEDADLDLYITRRAWTANEPPAVGQDIEGQLWLQGRLWSAPQAWAKEV